ncbi:Quinol monooxygenase YgiN [Actinacidiphila yanglinensis]|uniref:Quinol monooxygenase YgiN n=1 Tax=Actinacidiphila yanglinensis TaxID=310779 RepID=A0A1H6B7F8_9ACTN|nr:antibiotic biosynthesis monooxygenase [Actinacidiphila yanglinensis]SEG56748.1 Quinol monooxygenase YgiN [Actinacidiphila yanglinensis]
MAVELGLLVRLQAKPGKEEALADFLRGGRALAVAEQQTVTWYAFRIGEREFGIFDTFETEEGRQAHLSGEIALALGRIGPDLLASEPEIRSTDVLAAK